MRLARLIINSFGHFKDKSFDFGKKQPGKSDFHIFYGPNEAGKTTFMEAWLRFLFGIPKQEKYAFFYDRKNLKIAAAIEIDGQEQFFARVPEKYGSALLDAQGHQMGDHVLAPYLHGIDEQKYRALLCLDDETIEQGGKEIMESKGEMGMLLFSAASGLADFSAQLDRLEAKAESLHKKQGKTTDFAELNRRYKILSDQIKNLTISAAAYQDLKQKAALAFADEQKLAQEKRALYEKTGFLRNLKKDRESAAAQNEAFAEAVEQFCLYAEKTGAETAIIAGADPMAHYQKWHDLAPPEAVIRNLKDLKAECCRAQEKSESANAVLPPLAQKITAKKQEIEALQSRLPNIAAQQELHILLQNAAAETMLRDYKAEAGQKAEKEENLRHALKNLTVKGSFFRELPHSALTIMEAESLREHKREAIFNHDREKRDAGRLAAELQQIERDLTALRNQEGRRR